MQEFQWEMWRCQSLRRWVGPEDPCGEGLELPTLAERACQEGFEFRTGEGGEAIRTCGKLNSVQRLQFEYPTTGEAEACSGD